MARDPIHFDATRLRGYVELPARLASNQGFDGVWFRAADGSIRITESKWGLGRPGRTSYGEQGSNQWINATIQRMLKSNDPNVRETGRFLLEHEDEIVFELHRNLKTCE
jgi:hypothetical protein